MPDEKTNTATKKKNNDCMQWQSVKSYFAIMNPYDVTSPEILFRPHA
jgi:hypothetical protein